MPVPSLTVVYVPMRDSWPCERCEAREVVAYVATADNEVVTHTSECDAKSCGDDCIGGCPTGVPDDETHGYCAKCLAIVVVDAMREAADKPEFTEDPVWDEVANEPVETAHNYALHIDVPIAEAVEERGGRWYIKPSFAGYNSVANNNMGYAYEQSAIRAIRRYQSK